MSINIDKNNNILIFGGSGYLGRHLIKFYAEQEIDINKIYSVSRSESKIIEASAEVGNKHNVKFLAGDITDKNFVEQIIFKLKPKIIIVASAMKHIHLCEQNPQQALNVNINGISNVVSALDKITSIVNDFSPKLCFVSTDKAANPIGTYGYTKALAEKIALQYPYATVVRYGNVLNSPMSIIPTIKSRIQTGKKELFLTEERMTRFIMTVEQSVDLIHKSIFEHPQGFVYVPTLFSMKIKDLLEIYCEEYNIKLINLNNFSNEKLDERMIGIEEYYSEIVSYKKTKSKLKPIGNKEDNNIISAEQLIYKVDKNQHPNSKLGNNMHSGNTDIIISKQNLKELLIYLNLL